MTQSLILITTLSILAGLGGGYWLGYLVDLTTGALAEIIATAACISIMADSISDLKLVIKDGRAYE